MFSYECLTDRVRRTYLFFGDGINFWPSPLRTPQCATAITLVALLLCPHRARGAEPTPCSVEFRRAGFRARRPDGHHRDSVPRLFSAWKNVQIPQHAVATKRD